MFVEPQEHVESTSELNKLFVSLDEHTNALNYANAAMAIGESYISVGNEEMAVAVLKTAAEDLGINVGNEFVTELFEKVINGIKKLIRGIVNIIRKILKFIRSWFTQTKGMIKSLDMIHLDTMRLISVMEKNKHNKIDETVDIENIVESISALFSYNNAKQVDFKSLTRALDTIAISYQQMSEPKKIEKGLRDSFSSLKRLFKTKVIHRDDTVPVVESLSRVSTEMLVNLARSHPVVSPEVEKKIRKKEPGISEAFFLCTNGSKVKTIVVKETVLYDYRILESATINEIDMGKWSGNTPNTPVLTIKELKELARKTKAAISVLRDYFRNTSSSLKIMEPLIKDLDDVSKQLDILESRDSRQREEAVRVVRTTIKTSRNFINAHAKAVVAVGNSANTQVARMAKIIRVMTKAHWKVYKANKK